MTNSGRSSTSAVSRCQEAELSVAWGCWLVVLLVAFGTRRIWYFSGEDKLGRRASWRVLAWEGDEARDCSRERVTARDDTLWWESCRPLERA